MRPNFDRSYLKKQFEFFKTVKSNLKLSKNSKNMINLWKTQLTPYGLKEVKCPPILFKQIHYTMWPLKLEFNNLGLKKPEKTETWEILNRTGKIWNFEPKSLKNMEI